MNDQVRQAVKNAMRERQLSQEKLAELTGMERPHVNALLNGKFGKVPPRWQKLLDALDLELVAVPKKTS